MSRGVVYQILNAITSQSYIGSTKDLDYRWRKHKETLIGNRHKNKYLQADWNLYGEECFSIRILESCPLDKLKEIEQFYIDQGGHYNISPKATGGGGPPSEEARKRMSEARRGKPKSEETKRRMTESKRGENNPMFGKTPWNKGKTLGLKQSYAQRRELNGNNQG